MNSPISWESQCRENKQLTVFYLSQQIESQLSWAAQGSFVSVYNSVSVNQHAQTAFSEQRGVEITTFPRVSFCRSAPRSLWLAVTQWWRLVDKEWGEDCTPGGSSKVCILKYSMSVQLYSAWLQIRNSLHVLTGLIKLMMRTSLHSGKPIALWLCETEEHADSFPHARPQRRNLRRPLWKLQSAVHTGDDQVGEEWKREQVRMCSKQLK